MRSGQQALVLRCFRTCSRTSGLSVHLGPLFSLNSPVGPTHNSSRRKEKAPLGPSGTSRYPVRLGSFVNNI